MIVVSNASPIINLAAVGHLDLLKQLYGEITIPESVYHEIVIDGAGQPAAREVANADWITTTKVSNQNFVRLLEIELHSGEAEALAVAVELKADLILLDERRARSIASRLNLRHIGLLGILIEAKRRRHLNSVKPVLDALILTAGFWVSEELYHRVIEVTDEQVNRLPSNEECAEAVIGFRADPEVQARIEELARKSTSQNPERQRRDHRTTPAYLMSSGLGAEYAGYVRANKFVAILRRQAQQIANSQSQIIGSRIRAHFHKLLVVLKLLKALSERAREKGKTPEVYVRELIEADLLALRPFGEILLALPGRFESSPALQCCVWRQNMKQEPVKRATENPVV